MCLCSISRAASPIICRADSTRQTMPCSCFLKKSSDLNVICDDHLDNCNTFFQGTVFFFKGTKRLKNSSAARLDSILFEQFFLIMNNLKSLLLEQLPNRRNQHRSMLTDRFLWETFASPSPSPPVSAMGFPADSALYLQAKPEGMLHVN